MQLEDAVLQPALEGTQRLSLASQPVAQVPPLSMAPSVSSGGTPPTASMRAGSTGATPLALAGLATAAEAAAHIAATAAEAAAHVTPEEARAVVVVKALTRSDATTRRIILPRYAAQMQSLVIQCINQHSACRISIEANLPEAVGHSVLPILAYDQKGQAWELSLRAWSNGGQG